MAVLGAPTAGCPTSIWMTRPPAASMRAAAAITSITMKAGTSLRAEGVIRRRAESSIMDGVPWGFDRALTFCRQAAAFHRCLRPNSQLNAQADVIAVALTL